jgi:branched-chain amino acid transport system substrate-binding protein
MKRFLAVWVAVFLSLGSMPARSAEPYTLNAILSLTGSGAFLGQDQAAGYNLVEQVVNGSGGINGTPIHFAITDDQSSPQVAAQLASGLIAQHVQVILGSTLVAPCRVIAALVEENGPFNYCLSNGFQPKTGSYVFSINFSTIDSVGAMIRYFKGRGWTRLAYIVSTDATGQDAETNINAALNTPAGSGVQVVAREHFNATDINVAAQMSRIKAANPNVVITWATGSPLGTLLRGVRDAGIDLPLGTSAGNLTYAEMKQFDSIMPAELYFSAPGPMADGAHIGKQVAPAMAAFKAALTKAGIQAQQGYVFAWDSAFATIGALKKLGLGATAAQIRAYLGAQHALPGASGIYDFADHPQRGLTISSVYVVRWDKGRNTWVAASEPGGAPVVQR